MPLLRGDMPSFDSATSDGWDRALHWASDGVARVRVWSLGRDGKPGGEGEDADLEVVFVGHQKHQDEYATVQPVGGTASPLEASNGSSASRSR